MIQSCPISVKGQLVLPTRTGKVLGGGSSINWMLWARGHKNDWDYFALEAGDPAWNYESVLNTYLRIEDWHGAPDPKYRGIGGPVFVEPAPNPNPIAPAMLDGARSVGIPTFDRATKDGRRDYAILLLLARLGLRAGEVAALNLEDIDWENACITVRGKGGRWSQMPLPVDVGEAIAQYLRLDRPSCDSRRVFIRSRLNLEKQIPGGKRAIRLRRNRTRLCHAAAS